MTTRRRFALNTPPVRLPAALAGGLVAGAWANGAGYEPELLAIETLPDVFRTLGNVTADMAVMRLAGRRRPAPGDA